MIKSIDELLEVIKQGGIEEYKHINVELKREWKKDFGVELSALGNKLNNDVSWLVIGVKDNGQLFNYSEERIKAEEEKISQQLNEYLDPVQACIGLFCHEINGSWLIIIQIKNPGAVVKWNQIAYKATGTTSKPMDPVEEMELTMKLPGLTDYSAQQWSGIINEKQANDFCRILLEKRPELNFGKGDYLESTQQLLERIKVSNSNVAKILFGDTKYRVVYYSQFEEPVINEDRTGLYDIVTEAFINEIQQHCSLNGERVFSDRALKEALANSVAHAAYFENNGELIIEVYKDRLCISNLCLPESGYFANKWLSRSHKTVNRLLMETLRLCNFVDELGRGKSLIFTESLKKGLNPPQVIIEKAGRFNRWKTFIYGGQKDEKLIRLYERLLDIYKNENIALIAQALVLWRDKTVTEIREYIEGESTAKIIGDLLSDIQGPIFYYDKTDQIILRRWASILLGEGKDGKALSFAEEESLLDTAYDLATKYNKSRVTTKELRHWSGMTNTRSEVVLMSNLMKKWVEKKIVKKIKNGEYEFLPRKTQPNLDINDLIERLQSLQENAATTE